MGKLYKYKNPDNRFAFLKMAKRKGNPTNSEKIFAKRLDEAGIKYRQQVVAGFYILDFVLIGRGTIVEIDGGYHETREDEDRQRDLFFESFGWKTVRIRNEYVPYYKLDFPKQEKRPISIGAINSKIYSKKERKIELDRPRRKRRKLNKIVKRFSMPGTAEQRLDFLKKNVKLIKND